MQVTLPRPPDTGHYQGRLSDAYRAMLFQMLQLGGYDTDQFDDYVAEVERLLNEAKENPEVEKEEAIA